MTMMTQPAQPTISTPRACRALGAVSGTPLVLLRLEGAAVLVAATFAYATLGGRWALFAALFLVPDLSMLGYLGGRRLGAACYNAAHSYLGPAALAASVSPPAFQCCSASRAFGQRTSASIACSVTGSSTPRASVTPTSAAALRATHAERNTP
jgi:Domain of unknown function (DUF4260)